MLGLLATGDSGVYPGSVSVARLLHNLSIKFLLCLQLNPASELQNKQIDLPPQNCTIVSERILLGLAARKGLSECPQT